MADLYTKLLLHCNGADESTTFIDSSAGKTVTAAGTAQIDTAQKKFGVSSGLFDGDSDYLTVPDNADWNFGTGDFTIDFWVKVNDLTDNAVLISQEVDTDNCWRCYFLNSSKIGIYTITGGVVKCYIESAVVSFGTTWHHVAYVRSGSTIYIFFDGVSQSLTTTTAVDANDWGDFVASLEIGRHNAATPEYYDGWIDELRVSKGIARWTANFTPPTVEYGEGGAFLLNMI